LHVAKTLPGVGKSEALLAGAIFGELARRFERFQITFCETVIKFDLGHDDDSMWQDFGCLGLIFRSRRSTLQASTKKCARSTLAALCAHWIALVVARCEF